jgi:hypothetical protein
VGKQRPGISRDAVRTWLYGLSESLFVAPDSSNLNTSSAKRADLLSGLGAIVLGAGIALFAPGRLARFAWFFLIAGGIAHGTGMYMKHRLEAKTRAAIPKWETMLYWICWVLLFAVAATGLVHIPM